MNPCSSDASAMIGTDWLTELMDSDLDVNDLELDSAPLPGDDQLGDLLTRLASEPADHCCGRDCGCGFALQPLPQHSSSAPLPALAELLRCGHHGGDCGTDDAEHWLPELPDGMDFPVSGADPLEAMLAELSGPDERFGSVTVQPQPAVTAADSPTRPRAAAEAAAWPSPSVTAASAQTHASIGACRRTASSADGGAAGSDAAASGPAHSSDCANSAAAAGASAREASPGCESSQQAPQRSSSGSASPATSDSEGSGPSSRQPAAAGTVHSSGGMANPQSGTLRSGVSPAAAGPGPQQLPPVPAPQQWQPLQAVAQQLAWQQAQQQSTSSDGAPTTFTSGAPPPEEAQRAARVARNRESAQQSRQRKKAQVDEVQRRCDELQCHNAQLAGVVQRLTTENAVLRHQLLAVCAATGATPPMPVPPPPFAAGAVAPPPQATQLGAAPKIPIQKLKPQRPMPAPQRSPAGTKSSLPVSSPPDVQQSARKKLKAAAGATTALLAVFACVMLLSPLGPSAGGGGGGALQGAQVVPYAPAGRPFAGHGRVLNALPMPQLLGNASTHAQAVEVVRGMLNDLSDLAAAGSSGGDAGAIHSSEALAMRYNDPVLETLALQRLKELAPLALFSTGDRQLLPGGRTFGGVAGAVLGAEGLAAPVACQEVFRFDAARVLRPDFPAARMDSYIDSLTTPKRRRTQALPLLPVGSSAADTAAGDDGGRQGTAGSGFSSGHAGRQQQQRRRPIIGGDDDAEGSSSGAGDSRRLGGSTLVSMLLPTRNASAQQAGNLTALDQIYIVMMEPSDVYATYSCRLPSPVLL